MCKPQTFVTKTQNIRPKSAQQGFSLFIVLMVMIVVAFLVVSVTQSYNTEQRISTNDADHKYAAALAETALRAGESKIAEKIAEKELAESDFKENCEDALCTVGTKPAWERATCGDNNRSSCIENGKVPDSATGTRNPPRYIIEYISTQNNGSVIYRVTAKAWGKNANTSVTLQSYVQAE